MLSILIKCKDCGSEFEFTTIEQEFFAKQKNKGGTFGWPPPVRCLKCRQIRRISKYESKLSPGSPKGI
jgi:hypothetical protein